MMTVDEFAYYMIRLRRTGAAVGVEVGTPAAGIVERLDTGEQWHFGSGDELLRLMAIAPADPRKMQAHPPPDKDL
jgi:hypothetical protein